MTYFGICDLTFSFNGPAAAVAVVVVAAVVLVAAAVVVVAAAVGVVAAAVGVIGAAAAAVVVVAAAVVRVRKRTRPRQVQRRGSLIKRQKLSTLQNK